MKRHTKATTLHHPLVLKLEHLRIISGGDSGFIAPPPTNGSTASSCQSTKFNCC